MNNTDLLKLDNQLCFALYAGAKEMVRLYQPLLTPLGLTYTQYICMLVLWEHEELTVKELCDKTILDTGTITPLLKKLECGGLLSRKRSLSDERSVHITLTEKGKELKEQAADVPQRAFCSTGLTIEEALALKGRLDDLLRRMMEKQ